MNRTKIKYWGKRFRLLGDAISGAVAVLSVTYSGFASGKPVVENFAWSAIGLLIALVIWACASFISREMDGGDDD